MARCRVRMHTTEGGDCAMPRWLMGIDSVRVVDRGKHEAVANQLLSVVGALSLSSYGC